METVRPHRSGYFSGPLCSPYSIITKRASAGGTNCPSAFSSQKTVKCPHVLDSMEAGRRLFDLAAADCVAVRERHLPDPSIGRPSQWDMAGSARIHGRTCHLLFNGAGDFSAEPPTDPRRSRPDPSAERCHPQGPPIERPMHRLRLRSSRHRRTVSRMRNAGFRYFDCFASVMKGNAGAFAGRATSQSTGATSSRRSGSHSGIWRANVLIPSAPWSKSLETKNPRILPGRPGSVWTGPLTCLNPPCRVSPVGCTQKMEPLCNIIPVSSASPGKTQPSQVQKLLTPALASAINASNDVIAAIESRRVRVGLFILTHVIVLRLSQTLPGAIWGCAGTIAACAASLAGCSMP